MLKIEIPTRPTSSIYVTLKFLPNKTHTDRKVILFPSFPPSTNISSSSSTTTSPPHRTGTNIHNY